VSKRTAQEKVLLGLSGMSAVVLLPFFFLRFFSGDYIVAVIDAIGFLSTLA
jgi:hypothetical protein